MTRTLPAAFVVAAIISSTSAFGEPIQINEDENYSRLANWEQRLDDEIARRMRTGSIRPMDAWRFQKRLDNIEIHLLDDYYRSDNGLDWRLTRRYADQLRALSQDLRMQWGGFYGGFGGFGGYGGGPPPGGRDDRGYGGGGPPGGRDNTIAVTSATYGGNCRQPRGNVTRYLADACNGRARCDYVLRYQDMGGDPAPGCAKDFSVEWNCATGQGGSTGAQAEAGLGSRVSLGCGRD